jgi:hypothetical protein
MYQDVPGTQRPDPDSEADEFDWLTEWDKCHRRGKLLRRRLRQWLGRRLHRFALLASFA